MILIQAYDKTQFSVLGSVNKFTVQNKGPPPWGVSLPNWVDVCIVIDLHGFQKVARQRDRGAMLLTFTAETILV